MITDPLPEDSLKIRLPPGWPEEPPPDFAIREGRSEILIYAERIGDFFRRVRARLGGGARGASGSGE